VERAPTSLPALALRAPLNEAMQRKKNAPSGLADGALGVNRFRGGQFRRRKADQATSSASRRRRAIVKPRPEASSVPNSAAVGSGTALTEIETWSRRLPPTSES